jgi:hypothetical protein
VSASTKEMTVSDRKILADTGAPLVPIAVGELIDKITILEIKAERISDPDKLQNIYAELRLLSQVRDAHVARDSGVEEVTRALRQVNESLWEIEDEIREYERRRDFGARFVELARSVYQNNDERSRLKREINQLSGSALVEEKSYAPY